MTNASRRTVGLLTARYLLALVMLALLAVVNYWVFRTEIRTGEADAAVLNASGRQRMLLQHSALLAQELVSTEELGRRNEIRRQLDQAIDSLEQEHHRLLQLGPAGPPEKVERIYFDSPWTLDTEVRNFVAQLRTLAAADETEGNPDNPSLKYVRDVAVSRRVTDGLDAVVAAYQTESEAGTRQLQRLGAWSLGGTMALLLITGLFVFQPMARRVRRDMQTLEDLNDTLEERVAERTAEAEERAQALAVSEVALRSRTRILQLILDSMGDGVVVTDAAGGLLLVNPEAHRMLNLTRAETPANLLTEDWADHTGIGLFLPDQRTVFPHDRLPLDRALRGDAADHVEVFLRRPAEPREMWLSVTARPLLGDQEAIEGAVAVLRDVTGRKRSEQQLRDSEALYHSLVDNLPLCVIRKDLEGRFVFVNDLVQELLERPLDQVVGQRDADFYPPALAHKYRRDDQKVVNTGQVLEDVEEHVAPSGRRMHVELRKAPIRDANGAITGTQTIFWDVTARVEGEREHQAMQKKLLQSERLAAIGEMLAGVAHESRNALQQIQACSQLLRWQLNGDMEAASLVADIEQAESRLLRLFDDLRGYASPLKLQRRVVSLADCTDKAWHAAIGNSNGETTLEQRIGAVDVCCAVDPYQLEQVFRNLFENSLAAGGGAIRAQINYTDAVLNGEPALQIAVRDNGPGLPEEIAAKMFEPFFTTKTQGSGLGLSIVQRIIDAHGGRINVGAVGEGAEFLITLPRSIKGEHEPLVESHSSRR